MHGVGLKDSAGDSGSEVRSKVRRPGGQEVGQTGERAGGREKEVEGLPGGSEESEREIDWGESGELRQHPFHVRGCTHCGCLSLNGGYGIEKKSR